MYARAGEANSRIHTRRARRATIAALALAAALPAGASAQTGGSSYGGTSYAPRPTISGLECVTGCTGVRTASTARPVGVQDLGVLKVRGRSMRAVRTVIFTGRVGAYDDVRVAPRSTGYLSVDVVVPARANSGRVVVLSGARSYSAPSHQLVTVYHPPRTPAGAPTAFRGAWPVSGTITSPFGPRWGRLHAGIDIGAPSGTPIRAAAAGTVIHVGSTGGYGLYTCVAHTDATTCYAHQSRFGTQVGASVAQNQVIGYVGNTGNSSGAHLHFEVRGGTQMWGTPYNPVAYLPARASSARAAQTSSGAPQDYDLPVSGP